MDGRACKAADDKSAAREHEAKHHKLRGLINTVQDFAVDELKQSKEQTTRHHGRQSRDPATAPAYRESVRGNHDSGRCHGFVQSWSNSIRRNRTGCSY